MRQIDDKYYKRDFWVKENLDYARPHFRLEKAARIINRIARGKELDLLDVGCGPTMLMHFLHNKIHYHGIDIALHDSASNLIEMDFLEAPIKFGDKRFEIVVAQGVFEYVGSHQCQKFSEIRQLLKDGGTFISSYVNFHHVHKLIYAPYNNIQSFDEFQRSLSQFFHVTKVIPTSHRWNHEEPTSPFKKAVHMHMNINIPFFSSRFAVEYFFVASPRTPKKKESEFNPETALNT